MAILKINGLSVSLNDTPNSIHGISLNFSTAKKAAVADIYYKFPTKLFHNSQQLNVQS